MQRIFQAFVVLALLVLSPALAQSIPAVQPARAVLVLPVGVELSNEDLEQTQGKWYWAVGGAMVNIASGYAQKVAAGESYTWADAAKDAIAGAIGVGVGKAVGAVGKAVERTFYVPKGTGSAAEFLGGSVGTGATRGALDRRP